MELGFNLPAFLIALVITTVLVIGIKESANFNAGIVMVKVAIVLFVLGLGSHYVNRANWGTDWHSFAPFGVGGIGLAAGLVFFSYIGFDAVSTTAQEAKNPQRDMPIGIIVSLAICTLLYIGVAAVLTGMVYWPDINIEAPIVRAFLEHNLNSAANIITIGSLAGLTSVMLVMLLGQSRVLYAMAKDGLLPKGFFGAIHPRFRTPWKGTYSGWPAGGYCGQRHSNRFHRKDGEHWNAVRVHNRVHCGSGATTQRSASCPSLPDALCSSGADSWHPLQRLHDGGTGRSKLDSSDCLALDWIGGLLLLQPEPQQGAEGRKPRGRRLESHS